MTSLKSALVKGALVAALTGGTLALATAASADVVCNHWGDCWHVHEHLDYPPGLGIVWHSDAWAHAHRVGHWHWRADNYGHGYYRDGVWITF